MIRNCQLCKFYKDEYCENLELKPCYPQKGCGDFSKRNELKKDTMEVLDKIKAEIENHCGLAKENHCKYCSYCNNVMGVREILDIIDKYKTEIEPQESEG